jgi:hypothetical protein
MRKAKLTQKDIKTHLPHLAVNSRGNMRKAKLTQKDIKTHLPHREAIIWEVTKQIDELASNLMSAMDANPQIALSELGMILPKSARKLDELLISRNQAGKGRNKKKERLK